MRCSVRDVSRSPSDSMEAVKWPELVDHYIGRMNAHLDKSSAKRGDYCISDCTNLCLLKSYYSKKFPVQREKKATLLFYRGRCIEGDLSTLKPQLKIINDIAGRADDDIDLGIVEIKTTAKGSGFFDPIDKDHGYPEWIMRSKGYCSMYGKNEIGLLVFFLFGSQPDFLPWAIRRNKGKPEEYINVKLDGWKLSFTDTELKENWNVILHRRDLLKMTRDEDDPELMLEFVRKTRPQWMCSYCEYKKVCAFFKKYET